MSDQNPIETQEIPQTESPMVEPVTAPISVETQDEQVVVIDEPETISSDKPNRIVKTSSEHSVVEKPFSGLTILWFCCSLFYFGWTGIMWRAYVLGTASIYNTVPDYVANVLGCLFAGWMWFLSSNNLINISKFWIDSFIIGFCGAMTSYSSAFFISEHPSIPDETGSFIFQSCWSQLAIGIISVTCGYAGANIYTRYSSSTAFKYAIPESKHLMAFHIIFFTIWAIGFIMYLIMAEASYSTLLKMQWSIPADGGFGFLGFVFGWFGVLCRYALTYINSDKFFWGTFTGNITAALIVSCFVWCSNSSWTYVMVGGFCGGLSTLSTFSTECVKLYQKERHGTLITYVLGTYIISIILNRLITIHSN